nr:family 43 glycosylhydrolase [Agarivorans gilvus]
MALYHSKDLHNWQHIGHALIDQDQIDLTGLNTAMGAWAPCLSYCEQTKKFYLVFSVVYNIQGQHFDLDNYMVESDSVTGRWSKATYINSSGFDPSLFHDDDGRKWIVNLVWENRDGYEHPGYITLQEWDDSAKKLLGRPTIISRGGTDRGCIEAPHLYKRNGYYYLMTAEGGTGYGHAVVLSRATSIDGPYEADPQRVVLTSQPYDFNERGIDDAYKFHFYNPGSALQKSGHGSLVETQNGELYIAHLCARPFVPDLRCMLGRETAIQKCYETEDGWIRLASGGVLTQLETQAPEHARDVIQQTNHSKNTEFDSAILPVEFQTYRIAASESWLSTDEQLGLGLKGQGSLFTPRDKSLVARRLQSFDCEVTTKMSFEPERTRQSAGLVAYYSAINFYYLRVYNSDSLGGKTLGIMVSDLGEKKELKDARVRLADNQEVYLELW